MKRSLLVAVSTAALLAATGGVALAQEKDVPAPPNASASCIEKIAAFNDARDAHLAALDADEVAADARADDLKFEDAVDALNDHPDVADVAPDGQAEVAADKAALLAARTKLLDDGTGGNAALDANQLQLLALIDAALAAEKVAAQTDAVALGQLADQTDATGLGLKREDALRAAEDACDADIPDGDDDADPPAVVEDVFDCDDFNSRAEAQAKLNEDKTDPHNLDEDNDGKACENVDYGDGGVVVEDDDSGNMQVPVQPRKAPQTGGGSMAL
jgi:hypothetical protein